MAVTKIQPTGVNSEASFTFANVTATGNVSTGNLSASGNVALSGANVNLGNVSNLKITGGTADYVLKTDGTGNLSWTAQTGGGGGSTINVSESNGTGGNITNAISSISTLRFNKDTGIYVSDLGSGNALVSLGSTFKTWKVTGQSDLVAVGEDIVQFIEGSGITITTSNTSNPKNITFVANNVANANYTTAAGTAGTVTTNAQPNITSVGTLTSLSVSGNIIAGNVDLGNLATSNYFSGSGNLLSNIQGANISGAVAYATTANSVSGSNVSGEVTYAATANAVSGSNVTGAVAYATTANSVSGSNVTGAVAYATTANSVSGSNVSGEVSYAATANSVAGSNVVGAVSYATTANSVAGSNVSGAVAYATTANSVSGSNVSGEVTYAATANAVAGGNVSGQVSNALISGTVYTNAQPNITSVGTLTTLSVSGNALVTGNLVVDGTTTYVNTTNIIVQDPIIEQGGEANGAALSTNDGKDRGIVLHYYSGATIDAFMGWDNSNAEFSFGSNVSMSGEVATFNTLGNIRAGNASLGNLATASFFSGSGNLLSNIQGSNVTGAVAYATTANSVAGSNVSGEVAYAATANSVAGGNVSGTVSSATTAATVTTAAQPNITSLGTLTGLTVGPNSSIVLSGTTGYVKANSLQGLDGSQALFLGHSGVAGAIGVVTNLLVGTGGTGNLTANGTISASGNVTVANLLFGSGEVNGTGLVTAGNLSATANVIAGNVKTDNLLYANGTAWSLGGGGSYGNSNVATYLADFGSNLISTTGTITSGNLLVGSGYLSTTGNANVGNVFVASTGVVSTAGNITGGNIAFGSGAVSGTGLVTAGNLSATANVIAGNLKTDNLLYANGTAWSLGGGSYGNADVATYLASFGSNALSTTGNVSAGNIKTNNLLYANGTAWSLGGGGGGDYSNSNVESYLPTHTGNVSGNYFIGNGFYLTGITGGSGGASISNGTSNINIAASGGNVVVGVGGTASVTTFSTTGMVVGAGNLTVGTGTGGNLTGIVYASANASVTVGQSLGTVSGATSINLTLGTYIQATTGGSTTWSFTNPPASGNAVGVILELTNGGSATQIWTNVRWPSGTAPTLTSSGVDVLVFITDDGGSNWRGLASMINSI